ncbi:DUF2062 domain-containing protein [Azohydromonas caseinilytica]|uniref:DUF2062 domain-containing protein n=1 Tax=Azohydromonas caseinilytica TaxID=2728836 RepID=A0A848FGQ6_9BURK|nr:DUF2062 domain-containing protein [Azohydromonas caseinilytica]NML18638.1 DUF2062 domain-containing protein [Azohydromonas caseinilytica]
MRPFVHRLAFKTVAQLGRCFRPTPEALQRQRWLRWLGPSIQHPGLWSVNRHAIALGLAIGIFFGLLIPVAQMPLSAAAAVLLRAHLPTAVVSTFVTNPVTVAPLYYAAWRLGATVLGEQEAAAPAVLAAPPATARPAKADTGLSWWSTLWQRLQGVGKPLLLGLALMATLTGLAAYALVSALWWLAQCWRRVAGPPPPQ